MKKTAFSIMRQDDTYQAICLSHRGDTYDLTRHITISQEPNGWNEILTRLNDTGQSKTTQNLVIGYESKTVAFYRLTVPAVSESELQAMVKLQAEALLPLPLEEMDLAWRSSKIRDGKVTITLAAARKNQLDHFNNALQTNLPKKIYLDSEAVVKAWQIFYGGRDENAAVLYLQDRRGYICLLQDGMLAFSVVTDIGWKDLITEGHLHERHAERLAQDIYHSYQRWQEDPAPERTLYLIAGVEQGEDELADYLRNRGMRTIVSGLTAGTLHCPENMRLPQIDALLIPLGLAALALDDKDNTLGLFNRLHRKHDKNTSRRIPPLHITFPAAAVMLILFSLISYGIDKSRLAEIREQTRKLQQSTDIQKLLQKEKFKKTIAQQRAGMLELLTMINNCMPKGEYLDSISFRKKQPVTLMGSTKLDKKNHVYEFQENLQKQKDVKNVRLQDQKIDTRKKTLSYTITFDYKNFGSKRF